MTSKLLITTAAALIAGTAMAWAQNPPGSRVQDTGNNQEAIGTTRHDQATTPSGGSGSAANPAGARTQTQRQNESIGKPPEGGK